MHFVDLGSNQDLNWAFSIQITARLFQNHSGQRIQCPYLIKIKVLPAGSFWFRNVQILWITAFRDRTKSTVEPKPLNHRGRDHGQTVPGACRTSPSISGAEAGIGLRSWLWVQVFSLSTYSFVFIICGHPSYVEFLCPLRFPELLVCLDWGQLQICKSVLRVCASGQGSESGPRGGWEPSQSLFLIWQEGLSSP